MQTILRLLYINQTNNNNNNNNNKQDNDYMTKSGKKFKNFPKLI